MRTVSKGLFMFAGLLASPVIPKTHLTPPPAAQSDSDSRLTRLQKFFRKNDCPMKTMAADFIQAADTQELDWRLLPSIAMIESGGGKHYRNNNVFGWNNGRDRFPSVRAGIHIVAHKLSRSKTYRDKNTDEILRTYNPRHDYRRKVKEVMNLISMVDQPAGAMN